MRSAPDRGAGGTKAGLGGAPAPAPADRAGSDLRSGHGTSVTGLGEAAPTPPNASAGADLTRPGALRFPDSARAIARLAWPVFAGQLAVLAFTTVDTVLIARYAALDLAALAVGAAAYTTIFISLMGVVLALGPIAGQSYGARRLPEAGHQLRQAERLALGLAALGCTLLLFPDPFLALAQAEPAVADKVRGYLQTLACSLPAALLFTAFRAFNTAVSRPRIVMLLQFGGLALKLPLSAVLIHGAALPGGGTALPALGLTGAGIATALAMWAQWLCAWWLLRRDPFYRPYGLADPAGRRLDGKALRALLALGVPMGLAILIEVTGFTFMALFISRLGAVPVAGHQIAANLIALMFMLPLALGQATGTLVAQAIGAGTPQRARRIGRHGIAIGIACGAALGTATFLGRGTLLGIYTQDAAVATAALPLLAWLGLFHAADAAQAVIAAVLRAYRIATSPLVVYALALWGVGLGGGYLLAFAAPAWLPRAMSGASGFWAAATAGLVIAAAGLALRLALHWRHERLRPAAPAG